MNSATNHKLTSLVDNFLTTSDNAYTVVRNILRSERDDAKAAVRIREFYVIAKKIKSRDEFSLVALELVDWSSIVASFREVAA